MIDPTQVVVGLLRLMIAGEHPIDLKLTRLCTGKLQDKVVVEDGNCPCAALVDTIVVLDEAHLFKAPPSLIEKLRLEALRALAQLDAGTARRQRA